MDAPLPRYRDLPRADPIEAGHAWDVWGRGDELGRLNLVTPATVLAATAEVRLGRVFNLCLPLTLPDPPWEHSRSPLRHEVLVVDRNTQDDVLRDFYPQASTQWDGLRHVRARELGFYGGRDGDVAEPGGTELGIERWVEHGVAGRGVLADVAGHLERAGTPLDPRAGTPIEVPTLQATLAEAGVELARVTSCSSARATSRPTRRPRRTSARTSASSATAPACTPARRWPSSCGTAAWPPSRRTTRRSRSCPAAARRGRCTGG